MSRAWLAASYARWRAREQFRYARWRRYVRTKPAGHPLREKWHTLYVAARDARMKRARQISSLEATHVNAAGRAFIEREEGSRGIPYEDSEGYCTVGVGHLLHRSACTAEDRRRWTLSALEVDALLAKDLARFERVVRKAFKGSPLKATQARFNAAVSLAFNIGDGAFENSTVAHRIKSGDRQGAADAFRMWVKPAVLKARRERERNLFLR